MKSLYRLFLSIAVISLAAAITGCNRENTGPADASAEPTPIQTGTNIPPFASDTAGIPTPAATPSDIAKSDTNAVQAASTPAAAPSPVPIIVESFQENKSPQTYTHLQLTGIKAAPVNLPGSTWQLASGDGAYEAFITSATGPSEDTLKIGTAYFHNVASACICLSSTGTYTKPQVLTIKADLSFAGKSPTGYDLLGFYSAAEEKGTVDHSKVNPLENFTGLQLDKDGTLELVEDGTPTGLIAFTGTYDPAKPTTLTYTVNSTQGTISGVSVNGSTSDYSFTTPAFKDAATAYAGIGGQTDGASFSVFNNFSISAASH